MPRWADDTVRRRDGQFRRTGQEPDFPLEESVMAGGEGRGDGNNIIITISNRV